MSCLSVVGGSTSGSAGVVLFIFDYPGVMERIKHGLRDL